MVFSFINWAFKNHILIDWYWITRSAVKTWFLMWKICVLFFCVENWKIWKIVCVENSEKFGKFLCGKLFGVENFSCSLLALFHIPKMQLVKNISSKLKCGGWESARERIKTILKQTQTHSLSWWKFNVAVSRFVEKRKIGEQNVDRTRTKEKA